MIPAVVDVSWLRNHPEAVIADVRWYLDGRSGAEAYAAGHLPGAVFIDLDADLAAAPSPSGGRHPLPDPEAFATAMVDAGIGEDSLVVAYDDAGGLSAGRLVWMLRRLGVSAALLDGGLAAWPDELTTDQPAEPEAEVTFAIAGWGADQVASMDEAVAGPLVIDARAAERYRGETEPTGVVAGHIPGALSAPFGANLAADGRFLPPAILRANYAALGIDDASAVIAYCGSGVSACHDLLALEYAGLGVGRLFVGSWSAYAPSGRPVAVGAEPGERD